MSRVVVTGIGLITALGSDLASSWEALCQGKSGVSEITAYDTSQHRVHFGAQVKNFDPTLYIDRKEVRRNDPFQQLAPRKRARSHRSILHQYDDYRWSARGCLNYDWGQRSKLGRRLRLRHEREYGGRGLGDYSSRRC